MFWVRGRRHWNARPPRSTVTYDNWTTKPVTLVVHHTAGAAPTTRKGALQEMRAIQRLHQDGRGWNDIGYNFVIAPNGDVYEGRGWGVKGAHTENHNTGTIGVSFMGNCDAHPATTRQLLAYRLLVRRLKKRGARIEAVRGHRQMPDQSTACPGKYLMEALKL